MDLFAFVTASQASPVLVFIAIMVGTFWLLSLISQRNSQAEDRLERIGRPKSLAELEINDHESQNRFKGLKDQLSKFGAAMEPQSDLEKNSLKVTLANAGFRHESAPAIYQGLRVACLLLFFVPSALFFFMTMGFGMKALQYVIAITGIGFYLPQLILMFLKSTRQKEIFVTLPDALDLLVVCVESGLGLDAAMRKVTDEMKGHAKVITEEFALANLQLQMGRPRREVLHDLGVRTGVDDVRALAAILIQADRFGSSIAQALRVQSDSMRTKRRQIAEEKAAKTAVKLIFPLVLFIFPAVFVVLVGPAAIQIYRNLILKANPGAGG
ncbi:MAG: type II secretion system F family protein [Gemmataceae bacterium]|nr:type II secretion system F family protein [Gemmataceae bacterium]